MMSTNYRSADVNGLKVFYRQAGPPDAPTLLLLHGYPSASHMFRNHPGTGRPLPPRRARPARLRAVRHARPRQFHLHVRRPDRCPRGLHRRRGPGPLRPLRVRLRRPGRFPPGTAATGASHRDRHAERQRLPGRPQRRLGSDPGVLERADAGPSRRDPHPRPAGDNHLAVHPRDYFRTRQPPLLAIWGRNDPFFLPAGAEAFKRDVPAADVRLLDTGHFALETHAGEIAAAIRGFVSS